MARPEKLTTDAVKIAMNEVDGWSMVDGREAIHKTFTFKNFEVTLATHDVDGLTELDFKLAKAMDKITRT